MINLSNIDEKKIHLKKKEITFFSMFEWLHMLFFFFINLDRFFLTQGVGVDSGDVEELVFALCFVNSRGFDDVIKPTLCFSAWQNSPVKSKFKL